LATGIIKKREAAFGRIKAIIKTPSLIKKYLVRAMVYIILLDLAYIFLYPFFYMLITSIKTHSDLFDPTINWIPRSIKLANYSMAYKAINFSQNIKNSLIYTIFGTIGHLISCGMIGYGFARYRFRGQNILFGILLLSIVVPTQAIIVPLYLTYSNLGWLNSHLPVIIPTFFGFGLRGGLFIFVFRQFFQGLPRELEDAARIDGCGFIRTYTSIILPCSKAVILVVSVLSMVWHWNDFYEPELYASRPSMRTLTNSLQDMVPFLESPGKLQQLIIDMGLTDMEAVINNAVFMAGTIITIAPIVIVFIFLQKQFMQGIERTGLVE
jgi:multiple sugar transport system permease protein